MSFVMNIQREYFCKDVDVVDGLKLRITVYDCSLGIVYLSFPTGKRDIQVIDTSTGKSMDLMEDRYISVSPMQDYDIKYRDASVLKLVGMNRYKPMWGASNDWGWEPFMIVNTGSMEVPSSCS